MKKLLLSFCVALSLTACINDFDEEYVETNVFTAENIAEANTTIEQIRADYKTTISNSTYKLVNEDKIIEGIVTGNDISGNIYQFIVIQGVFADGTCDNTKGGIEVAIKGIGSLASVFPVGQRVRINLNGLYIGAYGKCPRIGQPYVNTNGAMRQGPMTIDKVKSNIMLVGKPDPSKVVPLELTKADINSNNIDNITPMLVQISNASIPDALLTDNLERCKFAHTEDPANTYSMEHDIKMSDGGKVKLNTSTSATFANEFMPQGTCNIQGIMLRYTTSWQMTLRSLDDVQPTNN